MDPKYPKVFAIVLNYNSLATIKSCLDSLYRQRYPNLEIIVADNGSKDGSFELAKSQYRRIYFIANFANRGFAAGNNPAIRYALEKMADYIFLLNSDAEIEADTIEKLVAAAEDDGKIGIVSPVIYDPAGKIWFAGGEFSYLSMKTVHRDEIASQQNYPTGYATGCAMLVRKEVFKMIGLLDEDFFLYYEDAEFCFRAKRKGFSPLVVPGAKVIHQEKSELNIEQKTYWLVVSGLIFFLEKGPRPGRVWARFYVILRRAKNWLDARSKDGPLAKIVQKAYRDYFQKNAD